MPQEQDMPAPVTTTIFLLFATPRDKLDRERRIVGSVDELSNGRDWTMTVVAYDDDGRRRGS